jgi:hypothetical protein
MSDGRYSCPWSSKTEARSQTLGSERGETMDRERVTEVAAEIAAYVIDSGEVEPEEEGWWIASLGSAVLVEADERGYDNASAIADEAVRLYTEKSRGVAEASAEVTRR